MKHASAIMIAAGLAAMACAQLDLSALAPCVQSCITDSLTQMVRESCASTSLTCVCTRTGAQDRLLELLASCVPRACAAATNLPESELGSTNIAALSEQTMAQICAPFNGVGGA